ncbi:TonB-dependent receptor [Solimonas sp. K1W22B-7]|uniref:TonB-dependent receptor family protein n=1 Tax=Solimonas sp. K1W22B-7 TaxID=2303331 RepID=UPI000E3308BD|nr:TonB-dependent receptor [Solimonas sp. K1W22B-7]AXQ29506.1 TonB-dependent receptor [Solimonas sp. K1W22B-7]
MSLRLSQARPLAALALLLPFTLSAHEVSEPGVVVLEPVTVTGERAGSPTAPTVRQAHDRIEQTPGGVDLVSSEEFQDRYTRNLRDMLRDTPGVFAQTRFAEEVRISIRGSGLSRSNHLRGILLLQDGIPVNLPDGFGDFQEVDPLNLRYVEVYKGGNGLRYGSSALGGAINAVSPTGRTAVQENLLRLEGGSFGSFREHVAVARAGDKWDVYAGLTANQSEGFRDQSETDNRRFNGNVGYRLGEQAETRFYLNVNDINQEIPGTLGYDAALKNPRTVLPTANSFDTGRNVESLRLANRSSLPLAGGQLETGGYYFHKKLYHPITGIVIDQQGDFFGAFAQWAGEGTLLGRRNELTLGSRIGAGHNDAKVFASLGGDRGAQTADADEEAAEYNLYAENRLWLTPALALVGGLQGVLAERDYSDNRNAAESAEREYKGLNPKLGLLYTLQSKAQLFANVSRSYEPPIFGDLNQNSTVQSCAGTGVGGFADLDAQKAWTAELGTRGTQGRWAWDLSVYRAEIRDEVLQRACSPTNAIQFNAGDTIHQGVEAGLAYKLLKDVARAGDSLTLQQVYTYADFRFDGDPTYGDNRLAGQPRHYYTAELRYDHPAGFHVEAGIERSPSGLTVDYANTLEAPGFTTWNLGGGVELSHGLSLFIEGRNLSDERYISSVSATTDYSTATSRNLFYPGEGRAVYGGLRWAW